MQTTLTLNTTFQQFAGWLEDSLSSIRSFEFPAEDGGSYDIPSNWEGELGTVSISRRSATLQEKLARATKGNVSVYIRHFPGNSQQHITKQPVMSFRIETPEPDCIQVTLDGCFAESQDSCPPNVRNHLLKLLQAIAELWPETRLQLKGQIPALFEKDTQSVESSEDDWHPTTRRRANLFKRVRKDYPNATQKELANRATERAQAEIAERIRQEYPKISQDGLGRHITGEMKEAYGKSEFRESDVRNAWKKMVENGEVEPWERSSRVT